MQRIDPIFLYHFCQQYLHQFGKKKSSRRFRNGNKFCSICFSVQSKSVWSCTLIFTKSFVYLLLFLFLLCPANSLWMWKYPAKTGCCEAIFEYSWFIVVLLTIGSSCSDGNSRFPKLVFANGWCAIEKKNVYFSKFYDRDLLVLTLINWLK